jgi:transposase
VKNQRKYTVEFKQEAVKLALKSHSIAAVAKELGIPVASLHTWINKFKKSNPNATKAAPQEAEPDIAALVEENRRLHKELALAKEEKEILKKAALGSSDDR